MSPIWNVRGAARGSAPPLSGTDIQGRPTSLEPLRGRPVLVHFWASWCSACKLEQSSIDALARDHAVLTVAAGSGGAYLRSQGLSFPALADPEAELAQRFGVRAFPNSFIVDPQGAIRFVEIGYTTSLGLRARLWWAGRQIGLEAVTEAGNRRVDSSPPDPLSARGEGDA